MTTCWTDERAIGQTEGGLPVDGKDIDCGRRGHQHEKKREEQQSANNIRRFQGLKIRKSLIVRFTMRQRADVYRGFGL